MIAIFTRREKLNGFGVGHALTVQHTSTDRVKEYLPVAAEFILCQ